MQKLIFLLLLSSILWSCEQAKLEELSSQVAQLKEDLAKAEANLAAATSA